MVNLEVNKKSFRAYFYLHRMKVVK